MAEETTKKKKPGRPRGRPKKPKRKDLAADGEWYQKLRDEEIGKDGDKGDEFPYFRGLARLGEEAGKISERVVKTEFIHIPRPNGFYALAAHVVVEVCFDDGTTWCGSADAHPGNCQHFKGHPTALAETRALGRAYRKALGIHKICFEEKADDEECEYEMTGEPSAQQLRLIRHLAEKNDIKLVDVIAHVTKREEVTAIEDLNYKEAQEASRYVADMSDKKAMKRKKDARKKA